VARQRSKQTDTRFPTQSQEHGNATLGIVTTAVRCFEPERHGRRRSKKSRQPDDTTSARFSPAAHARAETPSRHAAAPECDVPSRLVVGHVGQDERREVGADQDDPVVVAGWSNGWQQHTSAMTTLAGGTRRAHRGGVKASGHRGHREGRAICRPCAAFRGGLDAAKAAAEGRNPTTKDRAGRRRQSPDVIGK